MNTRWIKVGLAFVLALASATAAAQEGGELATDEARGLFAAGRSAYDAGRFEQALNYFSQAYELSHRGALLFNMASAAERLRRDAEALGYYERYLQEVPDAENRQFVDARIVFLRGSTTGSNQAAQSPTAPETSRAETTTGGSSASQVDSAPSRSVVEEWWFWTLIAVLVVGAGVGIGVGVALSDPGTEAPLAGNFGTDFVATTLVRF